MTSASTKTKYSPSCSNSIFFNPEAGKQQKSSWAISLPSGAKTQRSPGLPPWSAVIGIKQILLKDMTADLRGMWENERDYTTNVVKGYGVEDAFPEFIARKGRP